MCNYYYHHWAPLVDSFPLLLVEKGVQWLTNTLLNALVISGICTSWTEASLDSDNSRLKRNWNVDESGFVEDDLDLQSPTTFNSSTPTDELGERKSLRRESETWTIDSPNISRENVLYCNINTEVNGNKVSSSTEQQQNNNRNNSGNTCDLINYNNNNKNSNNNININNMGHTCSTESNCTTGHPTPSSYTAVGQKQDLLLYSQSEWQGKTNKAKTMIEGYSSIPVELNLFNLRRIRGDNYCGIRAVLFQVLASGIPIPNSYQVYNRLVSEVGMGAAWLQDYSFGRRLSYPKERVVEGFRVCLETLEKFVLDLGVCSNTEETVVSRLNADPMLDVQLCEAAKLHMLASALDLYKLEIEGARVPLFGMIMFARQSCLNPRDFMVNHLNAVGDSGGLEQIEMFLLGHALKVTLQVVRPSSFGSEDFICFYPDENMGIWPEVTLVAEDDRHYNVLAK